MEAAEAARRLLPLWVVWGPAVFFLPLAFALGGLSARLAVVVAGRPSALPAELHWTERARRTYSTRIALLATLLGVPLVLALLGTTFAGGLLPLGRAGLGTAAALLAALSILQVYGRVDDEVRGRRLGHLARLRGVLAALLLLTPHLLLLVATIPLYGARVDLRFGLVLAAALAALPFASPACLRLARLLGVVRPAPERLLRIVAEVSADMGLAPRETLVVAWPVANAFAFPGSRRLAFTELSLDVLRDAEVAAVVAHEIGHLSEPRRVLVGRLASAALLLPLAAVRPLVGSLGFLPATLVILALLALSLVTRRFFRRFEERADELAAGHERETGAFARALERLYEANRMPAVLTSLGVVHPSLYDRLVAAGVQPDYPRPPPPPKARRVLAAAAAMGSVAVLVLVLRLALVVAAAFADDPRQLEAVMALSGADGGGLVDLGVLHEDRGELSRAELCYGAATAASPWSAEAPARRAAALARLGRCEEAAASLATARERLEAPPDPLDVADVDAARAWVDACTARRAGGRDAATP